MTSDFTRELRELRRNGATREELLSAMHEHGLSATQAIEAARELFNIGLGDAQTMVGARTDWPDSSPASQAPRENSPGIAS